MEHIMGINPFVEVIDDEDPLSEEHCDGEEKWFPFGPSCNIHGKNVHVLFVALRMGVL